MPDAGGQRPGQVLERERVRIAGAFVGRALRSPCRRNRGDAALAQRRGQFGQDLGQVGVNPHDRRPRERTGEVAILAVGGTALGKIEPPVG